MKAPADYKDGNRRRKPTILLHAGCSRFVTRQNPVHNASLSLFPVNAGHGALLNGAWNANEFVRMVPATMKAPVTVQQVDVLLLLDVISLS